MTSSVVDRAFEVAATTWAGYRGIPLSEFVPDGDPRIAAPFGKPITAPAYRWRLSKDVWDALCDYAGMNGHEGPPLGAQLLGEPVTVDDALPSNAMLLEVRTSRDPSIADPTDPETHETETP